MRVVLMPAVLPLILLVGLPTYAQSQDYIFNVRVKVENLSVDVHQVKVNCRVCQVSTVAVSCYQPVGGNPATFMGSGTAVAKDFSASGTPPGPRSFEGTASLFYSPERPV